jgi:hypothetical protein
VPSQAEFRWKCAFTYMNAVSRKNLTDARAVDANDVDTASETGGAFGDGRDRARFLPDDSDIHLGRERPPKTGRGTVIGGWQWGSLTPQMPPSRLLTAAPTAIRAAKSAALSTRAKLLIVRNIAKCDAPSRSRGPRVGQRKYAMDAGRPLLPGLWSPRFFFAFVILVHRGEARSRGI